MNPETFARYKKRNRCEPWWPNRRFREFLSGLRKHGVLHETILSAIKKRNHRRADNVPTAPLTVQQRLLERRTAIPLGADLSQYYMQLAQDAHPQRKNWDDILSVCDAWNWGWEVQVNNHGAYSGRCTYTHYTYTVRVPSYGLVLSRRRLRVRLGLESRIVDAPRGYYWATGTGGIKLVKICNPQANYHPVAADLQGSLLDLTRKLRDVYQIRRMAEREIRARARAACESARRAAEASRQAKRALQQAERTAREQAEFGEARMFRTIDLS